MGVDLGEQQAQDVEGNVWPSAGLAPDIKLPIFWIVSQLSWSGSRDQDKVQRTKVREVRDHRLPLRLLLNTSELRKP